MALGFRDWGQVNRESIGVIFHSSLVFCSVWGRSLATTHAGTLVHLKFVGVIVGKNEYMMRRSLMVMCDDYRP